MQITVLTPAKSVALLELEAAKARLGVSGSGEDTTIAALIAAVSAAAVRFIGRDLVAQRYQVLQLGSGRDRLLLPQRPVDPSTLAVTLDTTSLVLDEDYSIDAAAQGILYRRSLWRVKYPLPGMDGQASVLSTFWAGYVPPAVAYTWSNTTRADGDWLLPTNLSTSALRFRVKTGGSLGATEPTWSSKVAGDEFAAGGATLVAHALPDAPPDLTEGAMFALQSWYLAQNSPILAGVASETKGGSSISYTKVSEFLSQSLPAPTVSLWEGLRW